MCDKWAKCSLSSLVEQFIDLFRGYRFRVVVHLISLSDARKVAETNNLSGAL